MKTLLMMFLLATAVGCGGRKAPAVSNEQPEGASSPLVRLKSGTQLPAYSAITLEGKPFALPDNSGQVRLINIWATWCGPCRHEIPELKALHQQYSARKFEVIGISIDTEDAVDAVREFVKEQGINYPVVLDPAGKIATLLGTVVLPTSALIDRSGKVLWIHVGVVETENPELNAALKKVL